MILYVDQGEKAASGRLLGEDGRLDAAGEPELAEDAADVRLGGRLGHGEAGRDLPVGQPLAEAPEHLPLARRQLVQARRIRGRGGPGREGADEPPGDLRGDDPLPRRHGPHGVHQPVGVDVLEQEPGGPRPQGAEHVLVHVERRQDQDVGEARDLPGGGDAVQAGHAHVHEHHVRAQLAGQLHRPRPVGGLPDHPDVGAEPRISTRPARTAAWSSATSTSIMTPSHPADGRRAARRARASARRPGPRRTPRRA